MTYYYRIRAFVDGIKEEAVCSAVDTADALDAFKRLPAPDTRCAFEEYPIEIAMVHRVAIRRIGPSLRRRKPRNPLKLESRRLSRRAEILQANH